jgi:hypothetical protein
MMAPERSPGDATHHMYVLNGAKWGRIVHQAPRQESFNMQVSVIAQVDMHFSGDCITEGVGRSDMSEENR